MKDIDQVRRDNMATIERELGGPVKASLAMGWKTATQWINLRNGALDSKTGKPRGMHKTTARKIERAGGKPEHWLDIDHTGEPLTAQEPQHKYQAHTPSIASCIPVVMEALANLPAANKDAVLAALRAYNPDAANAANTAAFVIGELSGSANSYRAA